VLPGAHRTPISTQPVVYPARRERPAAASALLRLLSFC